MIKTNKKIYIPIFRNWPVFLSLFIGFIFSASAFLGVKNAEEQRVQEVFIERAESFTQAFQAHLVDYENTLKILKASFLSSQDVTEQEYELLSVSILLHRTDINGLYFIPKSMEDPESHHSLSGEHLWHTENGEQVESPLSSSEHFHIHYSGSLDHVESLVGLNVDHFPEYNEAIKNALEHNSAAAAMPVQLFPDINDIFVFYPLFQTNQEGIQDHYKKIIEPYNANMILLSLSFQPDSFLQEMFADYTEYQGLGVDIDLEDFSNKKETIYTNTDEQEKVDVWHTRKLTSLSKNWHFEFSPKAGAFTRSFKPEYIVLIFGFALTCAISGYIALSLQQRKKDRLLQEQLNKGIAEEKRVNLQLQEYTDKLELARARLEEEKQKADEANAAKSDFLANMSHELRTPLNSILGMTGMLEKDPSLSQENREMADIVLKSATNLLDIVNDILDISKIESGNMVLEEVGFDFKNIVTSVIDSMAPIASKKGISLNHNFQDSDIPYVAGDPLRVGRILTNLISNAIKYTDHGHIDVKAGSAAIENKDGVDVSIETTVSDQGKVEVYCLVTDTGIGIPEDKLSSIFDKFSQADASTTRKFGGTGLGLAITKDLIEMMGGEIGVESKVGKGSTFWFKIPFDVTDTIETNEVLYEEMSAAVKKSNASLPPEKAKILIAEDHLLNQEFIRRLLKRMGFQDLDIVENGELALEAFKQKDYDIVLMDCHMPEKNGYEATKDIRNSSKKTGKTIPIIALTADAMKGTREKCLESGMNEYISKPINNDILKVVLAQWILFETKEDQTPQTATKKSDAPIDLSALKDYAETHEDLKNFSNMYLEQSEQSLNIMAENCTDGENKSWSEAAHKLKGGSGMIGAQKLQSLCAQAQKMETAPAIKRKELMQEILAEYKEVQDFLKQLIQDS